MSERRFASGLSIPLIGLRSSPRFFTAQLKPRLTAVIAFRFVVGPQFVVTVQPSGDVPAGQFKGRQGTDLHTAFVGRPDEVLAELLVAPGR